MTDLRDRPAANEVIRELLERQSRRSPRSPLARLFGTSPINPDDASWYTGALGEQAVGRQLKRLSPGWTVLHAIPVGTGESDIDHLLIGPPGVFTLNTKRQKNKKIWIGDHRILVGGQKVDHLRNARFEALRASKLLSQAHARTVTVTGAIVFVATGEITIRSKPSDVLILTEGSLVRSLKKLKPQLHPDEVAAITDVAIRPSTWSSKPAPPLRPSQFDEFAELVRVENTARRVRIAWLLAAVVAVLGIALPLVFAAFTGALVP